MLRHCFVLVVLAACGTETPRTFKPDASLPAAPFDKYAAVEGADAGVPADASVAVDAAVADAAGTDAAGPVGSTPAPASTALRDVAPFTVVLSVQAGALQLESADKQRFTYKLTADPGALFASNAKALRDGELARWSAQHGGLEVVFARAGAKLVTAHVFTQADAGAERNARDFKFAVPEHATLYVESRAAGDAGK